MARKRGFVSGHKHVQRSLRRLPSAILTPVNEASRFALRPIVSAAKRNLTAKGAVESGELRKSLTVKKDSRSPKSKPVHLAGPRADSPAVRYAHLVEFGTAPRADGHPGTKARPFLEPAYHQHGREAVERFGQKIGPAMEK